MRFWDARTGAATFSIEFHRSGQLEVRVNMSVAEQIPDRVPVVWGSRIPGRNRNFTGREALLEELRRSLSTRTRTAVVPLPQALLGQGGVGKTQLATEYVWRYRGAYDLVWWIPADQAVLVRGALAALAPRLNLPSASSVGVDEAAASVREALERGMPYQRWLLVFDNADQPEDITPFLPKGGPGHILITSRNSRWSGSAETVPVDVFTREESVAFLTKRLRRELDPAEADLLAHELGDLPLALEQAAALQLQTGISISEYLEALKHQTRELMNLGKATEYPLSMTAAWQLSVQQIEERLPEAAEVLRCCAFFSPEPIPHDVFRRGNKTEGVKRMGPILADPVLLTRALGELGRFALIRVDAEAGTIQVHRLVQALIRDSLDKEQRGQIRHEVHLLLAGGAPTRPEDTEKWPAFAELVPHVGPAKLVDCVEPGPRRLGIDVVRYLYHTGNFELARSFGDDFQRRWTELSGPTHPDVLRLRRQLGNVLWQLGRYDDSRRLNEKTLELMRDVFGPEHPETLSVTNSYGANLRAAGEFRAAFEQDALARAAHERSLGRSHPATFLVINNLALDYVLLSDFAGAHELQRLAYLEMSDATQGVGKADVLLAWNGLARVVRLAGNYSDACDLGAEAAAFGRRELGTDHPVTLLTVKDLSIAKRRAGEIDEALPLAREVHERALKGFGRDNPLTLAAGVAVANTLRQSGEYDEAFRIIRDVVPRYEAVFGGDHPFTNACWSNLALLYRLRGDAVRARELDEASRAALVARLGDDHEYSFTAAINLASDLTALGDTHAARVLGERTLERLRAMFGVDHILTLGGAVNLVLDLSADGATEEADALREDTLTRYRRTLPGDHPDVRLATSGSRIEWDFDPPPL
jgi:tetratricopeptide (TPR) repeat protein